MRSKGRPPPLPGSAGGLEAALKEIRAGAAKGVREPPQGGIQGWLSKAFFLVVGLIAMAAAGAVGKNLGNWAVPPPKGGQPTEVLLAEAVRKANQKLPMVMDKYTRLDSVTTPEPNVFQSNYTLLNIDEPSTEKFHGEATATLIARACSTPAVTRLLEMGVTNVYTYRTPDGTFFGLIRVTKDDCPRQGNRS